MARVQGKVYKYFDTALEESFKDYNNVKVDVLCLDTQGKYENGITFLNITDYEMKVEDSHIIIFKGHSTGLTLETKSIISIIDGEDSSGRYGWEITYPNGQYNIFFKNKDIGKSIYQDLIDLNVID